MKKIFSFGAIAAAVMAFAGCAQEIEQPEVPQQEGVAFELVAEVSTKTVNDGMSTKWAEGDALNVFFTEKGSTEYGVNNQFTVANVETGLFTGTIAAYPEASKSYDWFAIYPYNSYVSTPAATNSGYLTLGGKTQTQNGVDNMAHIAGKNYPLYGKLLDNPGNEAPALELSHVASLLKVVVKNTTAEPLIVSDVYFTAPEDIVGTYYLNVTEDAVVCTNSGADYVASTAHLKVNDAEVPANGEAAFYLAVKPFTAEADAQLALAINDVEAGKKIVTLSEAKSFEAGVITTLNFTIEEAVDPNLPVEATVAEFLAAEEDATEYILTGVITSVANTQYGNFYLTDETGTVYIYGLCSPGGEQKYWAASGAKVGDTITVKTVRTSYNGSPQGKNAIFIALEPFVSVASEWGVVGDLNNWGAPDVPLMTVWYNNELFVAHNVEIASGAIKVRANNEWNDAKNYGLEVAGKIYANKYYTVMTGSGSQNATPMEYGTYDVWFDLANKRIALMTPGKDYADAVEGGDPVVVIEGLADHTWGLMGGFTDNNWATDIPMEEEGDWAVATNVTIANGTEFKFRADGGWALSYGSACDVNVGETYTTYNNGGNMKFVGEDGSYNLYFSLVDAKFYMEPYVEGGAEPETVTLVASDFNFTEGVKGTVAGELAYKLGTSSKTQTLKIKANGYKTITFNAAGWTSGTNTMTITNGSIDGATTVTLVNDSQINSTNITNSNVNVPSLSGSVHTYTIEVTDGNSEVSITAKRAAVWGFTATK